MTVLVTGGCGYIGAHVVHALHQAGERVVVVDDLSYGKPARIEGARLYGMDIAAPGAGDRLAEILDAEDVDSVIHFAARKQVGLYDFRLHAPHLLSGGQKQRVAIAGVIAMQPKCIVLDEPTAMLDPAGRREVIDTATKLCREQGITVVLITHHMEECVGADRVIVLSNGAVVADGAPKQVFSQVDLLKREGLTAPVTVRLLHALRAHGMDVPLDALTVSDCADAVAAALKP